MQYKKGCVDFKKATFVFAVVLQIVCTYG